MMYQRMLWSVVATSALLTLANAQITHQEQGDAGDLPETAQATGTDTNTQLDAIRGTLGASDVDMYVIYIADPANFVATTVNNNTNFDTQLWLFDADGKGVAFNDDVQDDTPSRSRIDNSSGLLTNRSAGIYYVAVSRYNRDAIGCADRLLWENSPFTGVRAPNGPDADSRVSDWLGDTTAAGNYEITLTGAFTAPAQSNVPPCPPFDGWDETVNGGDAGDLPSNAQLIQSPDAQACQTPVQRIRGRMGADDVDMYVICITDPAQFSASTVGTTAWDTQLWLFKCNGLGVVFNDDNPDAQTGLQSRIDNRANCIQQGGVYLLAISRYNRTPVAGDGQPLWNPAGAGRGVRCPDGIRANQPVAGWAGATTAEQLRYVIQITGAFFVNAGGCCITAGGDVNLDGCIDDADLLAILFAFGQTGEFLPEDVTCDGVVDDADLLTVLFGFGQGC